MEATASQRVFISSTVRDFRDLRSALKFWLEELGLRVLVSEFNDFDRRPDQGTFDSCFEAIASCHFFVLLVGGRKGSEYAPDVSVTQQEFRVAVELARDGRIKPVLFVRSEVLTALREIEISPGVSGGAGQIVHDPGFVRRFVDEIRATEIRKPGEGAGGTFWLYEFDDFRDIADALRINLRLFGSVRRKALLGNLEWELQQNISRFCENHGGVPECGFEYSEGISGLGGSPLAGPARLIYLNETQSASLMAFLAVGMPLGSGLLTSALHDAVSSGEFLQFNVEHERFVRTDELDTMLALRQDLESYKENSRWAQSRVDALEIQFRTSRSLAVSSVDLGVILATAPLIKNIMRRSFDLLDFIASQGAAFEATELIAPSPFGPDVQRRAFEAQATPELIETWRIDPAMRGVITGQPRSAENAAE